jgi:hypothetical protein
MKRWQLEHCLMCMVGLTLDFVGGKGPSLSALLAGVSFAMIFLKLFEHHDSQMHTIPNYVVGLQIVGFVAVAASSMHLGRLPPETSSERALRAAQSDPLLVTLGVGFIWLDAVGAFAAQQHQQSTALHVHLAGHVRALGFSFASLALSAKGRLALPLALPMAFAGYALPLAATRAAPHCLARRFATMPRPWERPATLAATALTLAAVAFPAVAAAGIRAAALPASAAAAAQVVAGACANGAAVAHLLWHALSFAALFAVGPFTSAAEHEPRE